MRKRLQIAIGTESIQRGAFCYIMNVADVVDVLENLAGILQVMLGGSAALLFGIMLCNRIEKARDAVRKK